MNRPPSLEPCPFCGGAAEIHDSSETHPVWTYFIGKRYWMECGNNECPVMLSTGKFVSMEDCAIAWNTRVACFYWKDGR